MQRLKWVHFFHFDLIIQCVPIFKEMMKFSALFILMCAIGSHQQNILNGMPNSFLENYYDNILPHYRENLNYANIPPVSFRPWQQSLMYPNYHESSPSPYGFLNDYDELSNDDSSSLFRNLPDGRNSNKHQKPNLNFASNLIKSSMQMDMLDRYNNDPLLMQRQLFPLMRPRNPLYTMVTSTIDITSTVTCVVNSATIATTPNPITTSPASTTSSSTTADPTAPPPFIRSNASVAPTDAPLIRSLEAPIIPEDRLITFREKNDMIKDILISSIEEILDENYQYKYDNNRKKRMFFRYPVQTTLTSYILNSVVVTSTFTPNGVDCPPPGYIIC